MKRIGDVVSRYPLPNLSGLAQTYNQAPWRKQMQFIGLFVLVLVIIALIAGIYLNISARTTAAGRDIQTLEQDIRKLDQEIEDLQGKLAHLNSTSDMNRRAQELGFKTAPAKRVVYLPVQGYIERQPAVLAAYTRQPLTGASSIPSQYTESLFEWLARVLATSQFHDSGRGLDDLYRWVLLELQSIPEITTTASEGVIETPLPVVSPESLVQP